MHPNRMEKVRAEKYLLILAAGLIAGIVLASGALAQQGAPAGNQTGNQTVYQRYAPIDVTGNWVSIVTEDWAQRMITPKKGDYTSIPLNPAGIKAADTWDPAHDTSTGEACRSYAAPALFRVPGRLRISWQDNGNTLRIDADAGQQTRLLQFAGKEPQSDAGFQGYSAALWDYSGGFDPARPPAAGQGRGGGTPANAPAAANAPANAPAPANTGQGPSIVIQNVQSAPAYPHPGIHKNPGLAAVLSLFIPGAGQCYNGHIGKGLLFFFTSWLIIPWIWSIFDAYNSANRINRIGF